jgi:hypothetical protein
MLSYDAMEKKRYIITITAIVLLIPTIHLGEQIVLRSHSHTPEAHHANVINQHY